jgi:hypothetical protein
MILTYIFTGTVAGSYDIRNEFTGFLKYEKLLE